MPTPEQVEAVARKLTGEDWLYLNTGEREPLLHKARVLIAAYERARPAVSDEELVDVLQRARSLHHFGEADGFAPRDPDWTEGMIAGIRAIRERLKAADRNAVIETLVTEAHEEEKEAHRTGFPVSGHEYARRAKWLRGHLGDTEDADAQRHP